MSDSNEEQFAPFCYDDPAHWLPKGVLDGADESSTIAFTRFGTRGNERTDQAQAALTAAEKALYGARAGGDDLKYAQSLYKQQPAASGAAKTRVRAKRVSARRVYLFAHKTALRVQEISDEAIFSREQLTDFPFSFFLSCSSSVLSFKMIQTLIQACWRR